jgi:hypothetical protein
LRPRPERGGVPLAGQPGEHGLGVERGDVEADAVVTNDGVLLVPTARGLQDRACDVRGDRDPQYGVASGAALGAGGGPAFEGAVDPVQAEPAEQQQGDECDDRDRPLRDTAPHP